MANEKKRYDLRPIRTWMPITLGFFAVGSVFVLVGHLNDMVSVAIWLGIATLYCGLAEVSARFYSYCILHERQIDANVKRWGATGLALLHERKSSVDYRDVASIEVVGDRVTVAFDGAELGVLQLEMYPYQPQLLAEDLRQRVAAAKCIQQAMTTASF